MTLPMNKYVDKVGTEVKMIDYDKMALRVIDEVMLNLPHHFRRDIDEQTTINIVDHLRHWGDCFYRRGEEGKKHPALIQPLKLVG